MNSLRQVGLNVRRLRTARALSQEALALDAGIAINYLSGIERGARNPTVLVAAALRVSLADLVAPSTRDAPAKNLRPGKRPAAKK